MNKATYSIILFFLLKLSIVISVSAQPSKIQGKAEDYAGKTLEFFVYEDFISENTNQIFNLEVADDGTFSEQFEVKRTRPVFCLTGIYKLWFIAQPGVNYELMLPDFIEKTKAEEYNPYFKPLLLMAGVKSAEKHNINDLVNQFEYSIDGLLNRHVESYMTKRKGSELEQHIDSLNEMFPQDKPAYFATWKKFRFAMMRRLAFERNHRFVINKYFRTDSVHYQNPAYMELFNDVFKDYFDHFATRPGGKELIHAVNRTRSPQRISEVFSRMFELDNMALREYAIIKGLNDAYTRDKYKKKSIQTCLDSIARFSNYPEHRITASNVIEKFKYLAVGTPAPEPVLFSPEGDSISIRDFKDHYLYIAFFHTELTPSRKQLSPLFDLAEKHAGKFKVLLIIMDEKPEKALGRLNQYNKEALTIAVPENREKIKKMWDIASYPSYYLLNPQSDLLFSPSPAPTENFENYFFDFVMH